MARVIETYNNDLYIIQTSLKTPSTPPCKYVNTAHHADQYTIL